MAQQVRVVVPIGGVVPNQGADDDRGVAVEMFENPNLDGYLRRAQSLLEQQKYDAAIEVLQDVIEGRTVEFIDSKPPDAEPGNPGGSPPAEAGADPKDAKDAKDPKDAKPVGKKPATAAEPAVRKPSVVELDAAQSVFSQDGRVYRPVRRLCHEILSRLPLVGIELYRTAYEVRANELLEKALLDGSIPALEQVANRYFITIPAGRAMVMLADRLMHDGRHRAAAQVLRDLVEIYPKENRARLGLSEVWCRYKIALCMRLAGEIGLAQATIQELAKAFPDESLRILGELQSVRDMPQSEAFAGEVLTALAAAGRAAEPSWLAAETDSLVPLWQYRFRTPDPYREPKATNNEGVIWSEGSQATSMPHANRYGPATWVSFSAEAGTTRVLFYEHYRLRVADALSGLQLREGDGNQEPPAPRDNYPRVRIAASDFALLRPVEDEARRYVVLGFSRNSVTQTTEVLKASELVAYQRDSLERLWSSTQWLDGEDGLRDVTFLAAPTVFGERLLLPALRRTAYTLECLDRVTGRPLWHTQLHAGGSPFFKAPGAPVNVQGGVAFVATNAGCLAAVDAFAGDLRWIRRYEREDPLRPRARTRSRAQNDGLRMGSGITFAQAELPGFLPNDLLATDGLVIVAPCDGNLLMCVDGASGQPVWMLDATSTYPSYGALRMIVGANATDLFALSDKHLVCIGLRGGLVRWSRELPSWNGPKNAGRGRGAVVGDAVVIPGERELLVYDAKGRLPMRRLPLGSFGAGREPLAGSFHLAAAGPWLAIGYPGGIEMFSSQKALHELAAQAADPLQRANFLVPAGDAPAAEQVLVNWLGDAAIPAARQPKAAALLLSLVRERALRAARGGDAKAVDLLDPVLPFATDRTVRLNWHLARLEVTKEAGDLVGHEREQERLYAFMEGKG